MEPTKKSPHITRFLEAISGRTTAIEGNKCVNPPIGCGQPITGFRDELSEREYRISGLCQSCQDMVF
jgi:hypothetical protein